MASVIGIVPGRVIREIRISNFLSDASFFFISFFFLFFFWRPPPPPPLLLQSPLLLLLLFVAVGFDLSLNLFSASSRSMKDCLFSVSQWSPFFAPSLRWARRARLSRADTPTQTRRRRENEFAEILLSRTELYRVLLAPMFHLFPFEWHKCSSGNAAVVNDFILGRLRTRDFQTFFPKKKMSSRPEKKSFTISSRFAEIHFFFKSELKKKPGWWPSIPRHWFRVHR